jgi:hypothetical protein
MADNAMHALPIKNAGPYRVDNCPGLGVGRISPNTADPKMKLPINLKIDINVLIDPAPTANPAIV